MGIEVRFPGGSRVDAHYGNYVIHTDQPRTAGGEGAAPAPFDLFLGSLATCAGFYVLRFLQSRKMPVDDVRLSVDVEHDHENHRVSEVRITVTVPQGFPERYHPALSRAIDQCAVKRQLLDPPAIRTRIQPSREGSTTSPPAAA